MPCYGWDFIRLYFSCLFSFLESLLYVCVTLFREVTWLQTHIIVIVVQAKGWNAQTLLYPNNNKHVYWRKCRDFTGVSYADLPAHVVERYLSQCVLSSVAFILGYCWTWIFRGNLHDGTVPPVRDAVMVITSRKPHFSRESIPQPVSRASLWPKACPTCTCITCWCTSCHPVILASAWYWLEACCHWWCMIIILWRVYICLCGTERVVKSIQPDIEGKPFYHINGGMVHFCPGVLWPIGQDQAGKRKHLYHEYWQSDTSQANSFIPRKSCWWNGHTGSVAEFNWNLSYVSWGHLAPPPPPTPPPPL